MIDYSISFGQGHKRIHKRYQTTAWNDVIQSCLSILLGHIYHLSTAWTDQWHYISSVLTRNIYLQIFKWFTLNSIDYLADDSGLRNLEFKSFSPHGLNQNGEMKLASACNNKWLSGRREFKFHWYISLTLFKQPVFNLLSGQKFSFLASKRRIVSREGHPHRRFIDSQRRKFF